VLPPVSIAAFDPVLARYMTQITAGVPIKVVAVPSFDPATIDDGDFFGLSPTRQWASWIAWVSATSLLFGAFAALRLVRRRLRSRILSGPVAARRYAARLGRGLASTEPCLESQAGSPQLSEGNGFVHPGHATSRRVSGELIRYLQIGIDRPPGALTPSEAHGGVAELTGSEDLAAQAGRLTTRCDLVLYGEVDGEWSDRELREEARGLFEALGRVKKGRSRSP
jgi:hypothetical protein